MLAKTLFVVSLALCSSQQTNDQSFSVDKALQHSGAAIWSVSMALMDKLPANTEAQELGNEILGALERALIICDEELRKDMQFVKHNTCVATNRGLAMASLGEVAGAQWAKSGASRPGLFC